MAIQRKNPLPIGRYWVDIVATQSYPGIQLYFYSWLRQNREAVNVVQKEHFGALWNALERDWYLFDVTKPVKWDTTKGFGLPTIVQLGANPTIVVKPEDTVQKPDPEGPMDIINDFLADAKSVLLIGALLWLFTQTGGKR